MSKSIDDLGGRNIRIASMHACWTSVLLPFTHGLNTVFRLLSRQPFANLYCKCYLSTKMNLRAETFPRKRFENNKGHYPMTNY